MLPKLDPPAKAQIDADNAARVRREIQSDINKIDVVISNADFVQMETLHRKMDAKYQAAISDWGVGMLAYADERGFAYERIDADSMKTNLTLMQAKLEGFLCGWNAVDVATKAVPVSVPDVNVTVNNNVTVCISFDQVREKIENMTALSREQTDEIINRINELEEISREKTSRKTKWEKVKPIIAFALDKGADVAIAILSLVMQMKLGR